MPPQKKNVFVALFGNGWKYVNSTFRIIYPLKNLSFNISHPRAKLCASINTLKYFFFCGRTFHSEKMINLCRSICVRALWLWFLRERYSTQNPKIRPLWYLRSGWDFYFSGTFISYINSTIWIFDNFCRDIGVVPYTFLSIHIVPYVYFFGYAKIWSLLFVWGKGKLRIEYIFISVSIHRS